MSQPIFQETNERIAALPGIQNCDYGAKEARLALAIQDAGVSGGGTNTNKSTPLVGTSSGSVLAESSTRTTLIIQNLSPNEVSIEFGVAADLATSLKLLPNERETFTGTLAQSEIFAIASAAGSQIVIYTIDA